MSAPGSSHCYYDIFLSFRGEDTRKSFTDHLYTALVRQGFITFRDDDEAEKGENLKFELEKAIRQSKSSILVLSKDYATSTWCLDELVMILEKRRTSELNHPNDPKRRKHEVLPVFYDVKPSHLRKQTGTIAEAFVRYEKQLEEESNPEKKRGLMEKIKGWRSALTEVADLIGLELQNNDCGHEAKFIEKIIAVIGDKLRRASLHVAPYEIGMESRAKSINMWLQDKSSDVSVIAICGMGGIGKTTIAKYVYNQNAPSFDGSSFLADVREVSKQRNGLVRLQRQLLSDITRRKHGSIHNFHEGLAEIENLLRSKRVLLILDDVDHVDQIHGIYGIQEWLSPGSKVIITTRHERLLEPRRVYKVMRLDQDESMKLFSLHAFGKEFPIESYMHHTQRAVQICEGLPLALSVLGSSMSGKTKDQWVIELAKLEAVPPNQILKKLKISFDSLQDDYDRRLFLHIACFFVGTDKDYTMKVLDKCVDYAKVGIQNLIDRCLVKIDDNNVLVMHRLIQDMGREIVNRESPEAGERTRIWHNNDAFNVLRNETGTEKVEGLTLDMHLLKEDGNHVKKRQYEEFHDKSIFSKHFTSLKRRCFSFISGESMSSTSANPNDVYLRVDAFRSMKKLRLLKLNHVQLTGNYKNFPFPKYLVWLSWHGFPLRTMPVEFKSESLIALDLQHSRLEQVWKETQFLESLKILDLSYSKCLAVTPDFLGLPSLEKLILKGCVSLVEVCESIGYLEMLDLLDLRDCKALRKLPRNIGELVSLKTLLISGSNIGELPSEMKNMKSLEVLDADGIIISPLKNNSEHVEWWQQIVSSVVSTPRKLGPHTFSASLPCSLRSLSLVACSLSDDSFSMNFGNISLPLLHNLRLAGNPIRRISNFNKGFSGLKLLDVRYCDELQSLDLSGLGIETALIFAYGCKSLENIKSPNGNVEVQLSRSKKLVELEGCFEKKSTNEFDLTGVTKFDQKRYDPTALFQYGVYSLFLEGEGIPKLSGERCEGSCIRFTVPSLPSRRIQYLKVWCTIEKRNSSIKLSYVEIKNETKGLTWKYFPDYCTPFSKYVKWWSRWRFGNQLEAGSEITVRFDDTYYEVPECGFKIVYGHPGEEVEQENGSAENSHHDFPELKLGIASSFSVPLYEELLHLPTGLCNGPISIIP